MNVTNHLRSGSDANLPPWIRKHAISPPALSGPDNGETENDAKISTRFDGSPWTATIKRSIIMGAGFAIGTLLVHGLVRLMKGVRS